MNAEKKRNPGPAGGYHLLVFFHRVLPRPIFNLCVGIGSLIALLGMGRQRRNSRAYLACILGRKPTFRDLWRHFCTFAQTLVFRLLTGYGNPPQLLLPDGHGEEFMALVRSRAQILYGTFHIGCSDLLGYVVSEDSRPISLIRLRVGNSHDTEQLSKVYGGVTILWMNEPQDVLFGINKAIGDGASIAMQCDRAEYSSRCEEFDFLGGKRSFPTTIYNLSALYGLPVTFCFAYVKDGKVLTYAPIPFHPQGSRKEVLAAGREHFRQVLKEVEKLLAENPYQWFNFDDA